MGPRDGLDAVVKRKILNPCRESNHDQAHRIIAALIDLFWLLLKVNV
jgi:hypothetical protein